MPGAARQVPEGAGVESEGGHAAVRLGRASRPGHHRAVGGNQPGREPGAGQPPDRERPATIAAVLAVFAATQEPAAR